MSFIFISDMNKNVFHLSPFVLFVRPYRPLVAVRKHTATSAAGVSQNVNSLFTDADHVASSGSLL